MPLLRRTRGTAAGVGLGAALLLASQKADAAQEIAQLAAGDNRFAIIATLFLPVVGWVLFNIGGPALNQLNNAANKNKTGVAKKISKAVMKRAVTGAIVGLSAASLLAVPHADAANEVMQLAAGAPRALPTFRSSKYEISCYAKRTSGLSELSSEAKAVGPGTMKLPSARDAVHELLCCSVQGGRRVVNFWPFTVISLGSNSCVRMMREMIRVQGGLQK